MGRDQTTCLSTRTLKVHIRGIFVFRHVLVIGRGPADLAEIHAVLAVENSPRPKTRRNGVAAVYPDYPPFQVFRLSNSRVHVVENRLVVKVPGKERGSR